MEINNDSIIKMIDRSCQVLEYLYDSEGAASISKLAADLDLPKANVFRILYTLSIHGLVEKDIESDLYRLGKNMIKYGEKVSGDLDIVKRAKPYMKKLAVELGETVNIGIEHEGKVITLHSEEGEKSVLVSRLIPVTELHCSSMGKLLLADMEEEECILHFKSKLEERTVNTITNYEQFRNEVSDIKLSNIAIDREEYEYGLSCIAVPIRNSNGDIYTMVSVSGPTTRLEFKGMERVKEELKRLSSKLEEELI